MTENTCGRRLGRREWLHASAALAASAVTGCSPAAASRSEPTSPRKNTMPHDVVITGGGPAGLSAALTLGRARKRVLLCDAGPRRNAAAAQIHNFVTRDGTSPDEFRRIGRAQLAAYPNVEVRDTRVDAVTGSKDEFVVTLGTETAAARRVLLCTGMLDDVPALEGFREHWGHAVVQCPYCHGWESRDRPWGHLVMASTAAHLLPFALLLKSWTRDVVVFTSGEIELPAETQQALRAAGVALETARVRRLVGGDGQLEAVELVDGRRVPCELLFMRPPQRQTEVVRALGVALDEGGFVKVDPMTRETSMPGIYAAGDLTTPMQAAVAAAAAAMQTAGMINLDLTTATTSGR